MPRTQFVRAVWRDFLSTSGLEPTLLSGLRVESARQGTVDLKMTIEKRHLNRLGILHGGTIGALVDLGGSLAVASTGLFATGVSTDLNVTYLASGGRPGDEISVVCKCDKAGRSLAYTSVAFHSASGVLFARGSHTKYIKGAYKDERNEQS